MSRPPVTYRRAYLRRANPAGCEPLRLAHAAIADDTQRGSCDSWTKMISLDFDAGVMSCPGATQLQVYWQSLTVNTATFTTLDGHVLETHECPFTQSEDSTNIGTHPLSWLAASPVTLSTSLYSTESGRAGADLVKRPSTISTAGCPRIHHRGALTFRIRKIVPDAVCCNDEATASGQWSKAMFKKITIA